jgi:hypothetical protein
MKTIKAKPDLKHYHLAADPGGADRGRRFFVNAPSDHAAVQRARSVRKQLHSLQSTPTIIPTRRRSSTRRTLSRLEMASNAWKVITAERRPKARFLIGDQLILVPRPVIAGGPCKLMDDGIGGRRWHCIGAARAGVRRHATYNDKSYASMTARRWPNRPQTAARQAAEREIRAALDGILGGDQNAQSYVRGLILGLGFQEVIFAEPTSPFVTPGAQATP